MCTNRFHTFSSSEKARRAGGKGEDGREKKKKRAEIEFLTNVDRDCFRADPKT